MNCWHMLMGKGYNLLASSSGSAPRSGSCTPASLTAKFTSSDDEEDADNEHEEMVNELHAMVLIGNEWANARDDSTAQDDPLLSTFDPETATLRGTTNNDGDIWNNIDNITTDDESRSDPTPENIDKAAENVSTDLYSKATSVVQSALDTVDSSLVAGHALHDSYRDELLPFPVYEDALPLPEASSPSPIPPPSCTDGHQLDNDIKVDDVLEKLNEAEFQEQTNGIGYYDDKNDASVSCIQGEGEYSIKDLAKHHTEDSDLEPRAPASSSSQHGEQTEPAPRRSSQLSDTLRNNLERLLQRGPVTTPMNNNGRRRRTRRDDGLKGSGKRQINTSHRQQHRRHHHHHHHRQQQQLQPQQQEQNDEECGLYSIPDDDDLSLITDTATVRSCSVTSASDTSSVSDDQTTQANRADDASESIAIAATLQLSPSNQSSSYGDDRTAPTSKPVAMVQPRKVHGVRVLPSPTSSRLGALDSAAKPSRLSRSPAIRAPRPPREDPGSVAGPSTSRWTRRRLTTPGDERSCDQRRHRYARCVRRPANHNSVVGDNDTDNWQCRVSSSGGDWQPVGQLAAVAEGGPVSVDGWSADDGDGAAHEALLMTKKKDAEIAALLRHIRLNSMSRDASNVRRRPAFNECLIERINFERSLGYYP